MGPAGEAYKSEEASKEAGKSDMGGSDRPRSRGSRPSAHATANGFHAMIGCAKRN